MHFCKIFIIFRFILSEIKLQTVYFYSQLQFQLFGMDSFPEKIAAFSQREETLPESDAALDAAVESGTVMEMSDGDATAAKQKVGNLVSIQFHIKKIASIPFLETIGL